MKFQSDRPRRFFFGLNQFGLNQAVRSGCRQSTLPAPLIYHLTNFLRLTCFK